jgi:hypothetical protein
MVSDLGPYLTMSMHFHVIMGWYSRRPTGCERSIVGFTSVGLLVCTAVGCAANYLSGLLGGLSVFRSLVEPTDQW